MEASLKELVKLEKLASSSGSAKGKSPSVDDSLDSLLRTLSETKENIQSGAASQDTFNLLSKKVESTKKDIDERQKEVYSSLARFGKALDKARFPSLITTGTIAELHMFIRRDSRHHFPRISRCSARRRLLLLLNAR